MTATEFVDAAPLPTDHPIPEIPNGPYNISMNNNRANSAGCIKDPDLSSAWMCMPGVGIGITITGQDQSCGLTLDRYPLSASFIYGAQPPFINPEKLRLVPVIDRDSDELGTSLFAATYYDKLTICRLCLA